MWVFLAWSLALHWVSLPLPVVIPHQRIRINPWTLPDVFQCPPHVLRKNAIQIVVKELKFYVLLVIYLSAPCVYFTVNLFSGIIWGTFEGLPSLHGPSSNSRACQRLRIQKNHFSLLRDPTQELWVVDETAAPPIGHIQNCTSLFIACWGAFGGPPS